MIFIPYLVSEVFVKKQLLHDKMVPIAQSLLNVYFFSKLSLRWEFSSWELIPLKLSFYISENSFKSSLTSFPIFWGRINIDFIFFVYLFLKLFLILLVVNCMKNQRVNKERDWVLSPFR